MTVKGKQVRYLDEDDPRAAVDRADQIPSFASEADEAAWWDEHHLSEKFWRTAERVPAGELPPVRGPHEQADQVQPGAGLSIPPGVAIAAGVILALGAAYVLYRLLSSGSAGAHATGFLPTKSPNLRISA
jgi:hypothetical protein